MNINPEPIFTWPQKNKPREEIIPRVSIYETDTEWSYLEMVYTRGIAVVRDVYMFDGKYPYSLSTLEDRCDYNKYCAGRDLFATKGKLPDEKKMPVEEKMIEFIKANGGFYANRKTPYNKNQDVRQPLTSVLYTLHYGKSPSKEISKRIKPKTRQPSDKEKNAFDDKKIPTRFFDLTPVELDATNLNFDHNERLSFVYRDHRIIGFTEYNVDFFRLMEESPSTHFNQTAKNSGYVESGKHTQFSSQVWSFWNATLESADDGGSRENDAGFSERKLEFDHLNNNTADNRRMSIAAMPSATNRQLLNRRLLICRPWYFYSVGSDYPEINGVFVEAGNDETKLVQRFRFGDMRKPENANAYIQSLNEFVGYAERKEADKDEVKRGTVKLTRNDEGIYEDSMLYRATHVPKEDVVAYKALCENVSNADLEESEKDYEDDLMKYKLSDPQKDPLYNLYLYATQNPDQFFPWESGAFDNREFVHREDVLPVQTPSSVKFGIEGYRGFMFPYSKDFMDGLDLWQTGSKKSSS